MTLRHLAPQLSPEPRPPAISHPTVTHMRVKEPTQTLNLGLNYLFVICDATFKVQQRHVRRLASPLGMWVIFMSNGH